MHCRAKLRTNACNGRREPEVQEEKRDQHPERHAEVVAEDHQPDPTRRRPQRGKTDFPRDDVRHVGEDAGEAFERAFKKVVPPKPLPSDSSIKPQEKS